MDSLARLLHDYHLIVGLVMGVVGLVQCFLGYRIYLLVLAWTGFVIGLFVGFGVGMAISQGAVWAGLLGALIVGIVGASLAVALWYVGLFALGFVCGGGLVGLLVGSVFPDAAPVLAIIGGLIGGILAIAMMKVMIILMTAYGGAWSAVSGAAMCFGSTSVLRWLEDPGGAAGAYAAVGAMTVVLGTAGAVVQFVWTGRGEPWGAETDEGRRKRKSPGRSAVPRRSAPPPPPQRLLPPIPPRTHKPPPPPSG